ncbi:MAG: sulfatase [Candidatus Binatia bacterium]
MAGRRLCAALAVTLLALGCEQRPTGPANAILITIDTLRADHLGIDGYQRDTSPTLDALGRAGTWFPRCYAQSVTTRASHASLFTGCYPRTHGVLANSETYPADRPSLMTALHARGYATAGFVSSVVVNRKFGADRQFDHFDDEATTTELNRPSMAERPARATLDGVQRWLEQRDPAKPFFLWIHLIDPHGPYTAPTEPERYVGDAHAKPGQRVLQLGAGNAGFGEIPRYQVLNDVRDPSYYVARYDAEIRYVDDALAGFFAKLKALGLYDRTLLVVTADHGETLDEPTHHRYFSHGLVAYEEDARIPLIVHEPAGTKRLAGADTQRPVLSIDVAPTMLDLLGVEIPAAFEGRSVVPAMRAADDTLYSFGSYGTPLQEQRMGTQLSVRRGPWRYILNTIDGSEELYDHGSDPREAMNVAAAHPTELADLRRVVADFRAGKGTRNPESALSDDEREKLKALGYVR